MATIDKAVYGQLCDNTGKDFVAELACAFFEEAPRILSDLRSARDAGDAERYRRAAHSLKTNGSTFGASDFAAKARAIELGGLAANPAEDLEKIGALEVAYAEVVRELKALTGG